jgi:hypothetical protein
MLKKTLGKSYPARSEYVSCWFFLCLQENVEVTPKFQVATAGSNAGLPI